MTAESVELLDGTIIEANWNGRGTYYKAKIVSVNENGTYDIYFDDGET